MKFIGFIAIYRVCQVSRDTLYFCFELKGFSVYSHFTSCNYTIDEGSGQLIAVKDSVAISEYT